MIRNDLKDLGKLLQLIN